MYQAKLEEDKRQPVSGSPRLRSTALLVAAAMVLSGCVNESSTSALSSTEIEAKETSHEQKYVASKCNSANRLASSNKASAVLNGKLSEYSKAEATLDAASKSKILAELEAHGNTLAQLDQVLKVECKSFSECEHQASINKQDCRQQKAKYATADKEMLKFSKQLERLKAS